MDITKLQGSKASKPAIGGDDRVCNHEKNPFQNNGKKVINGDDRVCKSGLNPFGAISAAAPKEMSPLENVLADAKIKV